jgi:hypothetical protein
MEKKNRLLEERFPGFQTKEIVEEEGLHAYIFSDKHEEEKSPCYNYGYYIGDDVRNSFNTQLLVVPQDQPNAAADCHAIVRIDGYSFISERYDDHAVTVSCELGTGQKMIIDNHSYYQKYGGQSRNTTNPLAPLLNYLRDKLGYSDLTEERLANWIAKMRGRFAH